MEFHRISVPHDQRWLLLKDVIVHLFQDENPTIPQLARRMKQDHDFDAQPPHYRFRLQQWGVKKRTATKDKSQAH
ncbi:hypothetical protein B0H63DRAFT_520844 [Podospora didyma]|uniref:Clr5 domain-containing protein n=1 Tax=Podospora didyma TaxID=330526 RepID=A0AAE0U170_9PEZI|nr:hypothetical protein B0H63DRAFT_520844 [Podospora didyma]